MSLTPMQFRDYVWPHNPIVYTIDYVRPMAVHKVPFGRYVLQDLGPSRRIMKGEGEFVGEGAYEEFRKLASVFYQNEPGLLVHPVWQSTKAYFVDLSLRQEPRKDYVRYTFTFWEDFDGYGTTLQKVTQEVESPTNTQDIRYHVVVRGDNLWAIAKAYGITLAQIIALNPQIKNPSLIYPGEKVRVA